MIFIATSSNLQASTNLFWAWSYLESAKFSLSFWTLPSESLHKGNSCLKSSIFIQLHFVEHAFFPKLFMSWWNSLATGLPLVKSPLLSKIKHSSHNRMACRTKPVLRRKLATVKPMLIADVVNSFPVFSIISLFAVGLKMNGTQIWYIWGGDSKHFKATPGLSV